MNSQEDGAFAGLIPRVVTSCDGHRGFKISAVGEDQRGSSVQLHFDSYFAPGDPSSTIVVGLPPTVPLHEGAWDLEGAREEKVAHVVLATLGLLAGGEVKRGKNPKHELTEAPTNILDYARRLRDVKLPDDADMWRYVCSKIFWGWRYGLRVTRFDAVDELQLGLRRNEILEKYGVEPKQLDRVASAGERIYWRKTEDGYTPMLDFLCAYPNVELGLAEP